MAKHNGQDVQGRFVSPTAESYHPSYLGEGGLGKAKVFIDWGRVGSIPTYIMR